MDKMTYAGVGVDYNAMDSFKRDAQLKARETAENLKRYGFAEVEWSRGESCYLIDIGDAYLAHVEEGLGTKNLVADQLRREILHVVGELVKYVNYSYYREVAQCTVAMIVNDMITLGALPLSIAMHLAVGTSEWFKDEDRNGELINGFKNSCMLARCAWGPGETPTLKDIVMPDAAVLSGSAIGIVKPKERVIKPGNIKPGDVIILLPSSGIHANGLTMARKIAGSLPEGYLTMVDDERNYGDTLLEPTYIYVPFVEDCLDFGVDIHYAVNITGHGWRKLMRAPQTFRYVIECLPPSLPIFEFMQKHGSIDDMEAYGNLNMGAGFALYVSEDGAKKIEEIYRQFGRTYPSRPIRAGHIEQSHEKEVIIKPRNLKYSGVTLAVR